MPNLILTILFSFVCAFPAFSLAQSVSGPLVRVQDYDFSRIDLHRYTDAPWDDETNKAVSLLTDLGIIEGNIDGTFREELPLNRAEFVQIMMRLLPPGIGVTTTMQCFPDVRPDLWFAEPVCRAKSLGIIHGNARAGVPADQWNFEPVRAVQYEEAALMLTELFAFPVTRRQGKDWFVPYIRLLYAERLDLPGVRPGDAITRGEMARLTAMFIALHEGRLDDYQHAQSISISSASSSVSSVAPASRSASSVVGSVASSVASLTPVQSAFLLLGTVSPPLAGVQYFTSLEPVHTDTLIVTLMEEAPSVSSLSVYDEHGALLGIASHTSDARTYRLTLAADAFSIPQRVERRLYVTARIASDTAGGRSGETVQVATIRLEATGEWSGEAYAIDSTSVFPIFQTALARVTAVKSTLPAEAILGPGEDQIIAAFAFSGEEVLPSGDLRVTSLAFDVSASAHFTLDAVELGVIGLSVRAPCTVSSSRIVCADLPASIGTIQPNQAIRMYADVSVASLAGDRHLQITLDEPGLPGQSGDVTWTDGTTSFTWTGLERPLATGTRWR